MPRTMQFTRIDNQCAVGQPVPPDWRWLHDSRCLILVGLTGVGKTTILSELIERLPDVYVLPNRRKITDALMFPEVQERDGLPIEPVTDRDMRFRLTRRYRELHPGGMAYALNQLSIAPSAAHQLLIFDGLRGENEIRHAEQYLRSARYLMLDAPDAVRIERLAKRQDEFDHISTSGESTQSQASTASFESLGIPELAELLSMSECERLLELVTTGAIGADELAARGRIVLSERRNYNPDATRMALQDTASDRSLIVDTTQNLPEHIVSKTMYWLGV